MPFDHSLSDLMRPALSGTERHAIARRALFMSVWVAVIFGALVSLSTDAGAKSLALTQPRVSMLVCAYESATPGPAATAGAGMPH
jgi:cytochrome bd-type quinol oxidase subunit 1